MTFANREDDKASARRLSPQRANRQPCQPEEPTGFRKRDRVFVGRVLSPQQIAGHSPYIADLF